MSTNSVNSKRSHNKGVYTVHAHMYIYLMLYVLYHIVLMDTCTHKSSQIYTVYIYIYYIMQLHKSSNARRDI